MSRIGGSTSRSWAPPNEGDSSASTSSSVANLVALPSPDTEDREPEDFYRGVRRWRTEAEGRTVYCQKRNAIKK